MQFDQESRIWFAPTYKLTELLNIVKKEGLLVDLSEDCQKILGVTRDGYSEDEIKAEHLKWQDHPSYASSAPEDFSLEHLGLLREPFPFQVAGIYYGYSIAGGRLILGDQPGLGKTIQAIIISALFRQDWPVFVAAPASLTFNWKKEFLLTLDWLSEEDIHIIDNAKNSKPRGLITIGSYHQLHANFDNVVEYLNTRGVLIIDEAHAIKNPESQRGVAAIELGNLAKRYMPITGTPILNRTREIFPALNGICPISWPDYKRFTDRYSEGHMQKFDTKSVYYNDGASNLGELQEKLRSGFMVRRLKSVVLDQLPKKNRHSIYLNATKDDKELDTFILEVSEQVYSLLDRGINDINKLTATVKSYLADSPTGSILTGYEKAGLAKLPEIVSFLEDKWEAEPDNKFIVFVHNQSLLKEISKQFAIKQPNKKAIVIDGSVPPAKRFEFQEQFQNDEETTLALLTLGAASTGLTLTKASTVLMAQLPWTPGIATQAEDRAHRISQSDEVNVVYLLGNNAFDAYLWRMLETKSAVEQFALDGALGSSFEQTSDELSDDDIIKTIVTEIIESREDIAA
ncbi:DEAD/DEAH box helicase [Vibrio sp. D431a]|uniref:DEAD/DEAH box helicase n=1 Tax=Vibrio sp. D431a TaxID=2837388 RepID=UPI00255674D4|nr:DEAD/DEAH box helicase [Vibrio sp. D431a]MDK9793835.1 DEAD/DEAH box helicase [Vibrio sp. D431a]